jgi:hypothetical protein
MTYAYSSRFWILDRWRQSRFGAAGAWPLELSSTPWPVGARRRLFGVDAGDQALGDLRTYRWSRSALVIRPLALRRPVTVSGQSIPGGDKSKPSTSVIVFVPVLAHTAPIAPSPSSVTRKRKYRMAVGGSFGERDWVGSGATSEGLDSGQVYDEPVERLYIVLYVCTRAVALSMHSVGTGIKQRAPRIDTSSPTSGGGSSHNMSILRVPRGWRHNGQGIAHVRVLHIPYCTCICILFHREWVIATSGRVADRPRGLRPTQEEPV